MYLARLNKSFDGCKSFITNTDRRTVMKEISDSDRWNPAHFGEMPRQLDSEGNPTIFWDQSIEPPEPDDYDTLAEYEEAWHKWEQENSECLTCAAELEAVSPSVELPLEKSNYADSVKSTHFVNKSCKNGSPVYQSTTTCATSEFKREKSTQLPHHHRVSLSALKGIEGEEPTNETVSPQFYNLFPESNLNSFVSKTYPDYCRLPNTQETNLEHIFYRCSGSFMNMGTMRNGSLSERDFASEPNGREKDSYSLPRPGAASLEWKRTTSWEHQIGSQSQEIGFNRQEGSIQSRVARTTIRATNRLDIPTGTPSGNRVNRARRAALGNCLDVRLAQIVWERVFYLYSLS